MAYEPAKDLKNTNLEELKFIIESYKQPSYQAREIFCWIHDKGVQSIKEMTNLSNDFRQKLIHDGYYISQLKIIKQLESVDRTRKYLFELYDKQKIETVLLNDDDHFTLCVSSQVGCRQACQFCATGKMNFRRNLSAGEIVDQVIQIDEDLRGKMIDVSKSKELVKAQVSNLSNLRGQVLNLSVRTKIRNIVFMGMGEPFDNYNAVLKAIHILNNKDGKNIGARHMTISTCGLAPEMKKFADENFQVRLAISLHSVDDKIRAILMPIARRYNLKELKSALQYYQEKTKRRITVEYLLLKNLNEQVSDAEHLISYLKGLDVNVNLIEYNDFPGAPFQSVSKDQARAFKEMLEKAGIETACRFRRGREIKAACGQLGSR
jgi:23S rRNA (adenine2503-C2)-methyltransferase